MKTVHIEDLIEGDKILISIGNDILTLEVSEINIYKGYVLCKDNVLEFYPDENGIFMQP